MLGVVMLKKVERTIKKYHMLDGGERVLVAVSGGPDSSALLDVLCSIRDRYKLSLSVAHLNHMFRGKEADGDARYVEELSKKFGLPFFSGKKNVRLFMKKAHLSPEEAARKLRYDFLKKVAENENLDKVALGQTADDQAETVLISLIRGTGLAGLSGIPPVRLLGKSGIQVIRPLVEVYRSEIEKYLKMKKITPRLDASNMEPVYLRNRIRLELLPLLGANYNPNIRSSLVRLASILRDNNQYLVEEAEKLMPELLKRGKGKVEIDLGQFESVPGVLQQRIVREAINTVSGNRRPLSITHWEQVRELARSGRTGSYLNLPGRVLVKKEYGNLLIMRQGISGKDGVHNINCKLEVPGRNYISEIGLVIDVSFPENGQVPISASKLLRSTEGRERFGGRKAIFDCERIKFPLHIRFRAPGDRFRPLGMKGSKKLKDFFIDRKVPVGDRDRTPLLVGNGEIIWVMDPDERGWNMIAERVKVTGRTARTVQVEIV